MNAAMSSLKTRWDNLNLSYKKYLLGIILLAFLNFLIALFFVSVRKDDNLSKSIIQLEKKRTAEVTEQIRTIRTQIDKLALSTPDSTQGMKINSELATIEKDMANVAKSGELQKIASDVESRLDSLEKMITESGHAKQYVDAKLLPFRIISVDVISQQIFISVEYDHRITPLGIGDSLAGWKIIDANYESVSVELENNEGRYVKVNVLGKQEMGGEKE